MAELDWGESKESSPVDLASGDQPAPAEHPIQAIRGLAEPTDPTCLFPRKERSAHSARTFPKAL